MTTLEEKFQTQIDALREMQVDEYEGVIDHLIKELEAAGLFPKYEKVLLEIDNAFDNDFDQQFEEMQSVLDGIKKGASI